jgi:hypothetical protein
MVAKKFMYNSVGLMLWYCANVHVNLHLNLLNDVLIKGPMAMTINKSSIL